MRSLTGDDVTDDDITDSDIITVMVIPLMMTSLMAMMTPLSIMMVGDHSRHQWFGTHGGARALGVFSGNVHKPPRNLIQKREKSY